MGRLIVHLKRYGGTSSRKADHRVDIPLNIELSPWVVGSVQKREPNYNLYGAVEYHGHSIEGGHYTAVARRDGAWFSFDDLRSKQCQGATAIQSSAVALLFFERKGDSRPHAQQSWNPQGWPHDPATT